MKIQEELKDLNEELLKMSDKVYLNMTQALNYYFNEKESVIDDDEIDHYEREIESKCIKILLHERPYASDLKEVTGILKLVEDLERIGDHAEDIQTFSKKLNKRKGAFNNQVLKLANDVMGMLENAIKAYRTNNIELASLVIKQDDLVDSTYETIIDELAAVSDIKGDISLQIYTAIVVKYLERVADHSVNICEWLIYIANGYHKDASIL